MKSDAELAMVNVTDAAVAFVMLTKSVALWAMPLLLKELDDSDTLLSVVPDPPVLGSFFLQEVIIAAQAIRANRIVFVINVILCCLSVVYRLFGLGMSFCGLRSSGLGGRIFISASTYFSYCFSESVFLIFSSLSRAILSIAALAAGSVVP